MKNSYVKAGKCPFCQGTGWKNGMPCDDCLGVGTLDAMWERHAEQLDIRRAAPDDGAI